MESKTLREMVEAPLRSVPSFELGNDEVFKIGLKRFVDEDNAGIMSHEQGKGRYPEVANVENSKYMRVEIKTWMSKYFARRTVGWQCS